MAEKWTIAFGRYLRTLRERRGLSLDEVESLSEAFPDPIHKAYLSKCENGRQSLAFSKLVALCRIYEVPPEVLTERLQLDMELEKTDAPDTAGQTLNHAIDVSLAALQEGFVWRAYALIRDVLPQAKYDPIRKGYRDHSEQDAVAHMNCATVALRLDRLRYALHEFRFVASSNVTGPRYSVIARERVAACLRRLGKLDESKREIDDAIAQAETAGDEYCLGYCYTTRAVLALDGAELDVAAQYYEKAYKSYRAADSRFECARTLANLADSYYESGRLRAARRALNESLGISAQHGFKRSEAIAKILLGMIDFAEQRAPSAVRQLHEAAETAEELNDRVLWFKAEFQLFKHAVSIGQEHEARRLQSQLGKLISWVPPDTPELAEFTELSA